MFKRKIRDRLAAKAAFSVLALALVAAGFSTPAQARHHHHAHHAHAAHHGGVHARVAARHHHHHAAAVPMSATAAIVVDGATGHMIYGMNENALRHPASITKVMTLYLLFEQLEKGRYALDDEIPISAHAAAQSPSKLGLRPGSTIRVEEAIRAIVTKSANDIAVAIAEFVGGTESNFAEEMTAKAHSLGMTRTNYANASGLPNEAQITTAADLAILGRAIQERFPRYYRYFSIHEFAFRGQRIHTHNHLMDRYAGMDGIKTGYTAASGFNLLSSVKRDGHFVVAVVMGGKSARSRDNYMEALLDKYTEEAGAPRAARVAEQEETTREETARNADVEAPRPTAPVAAAPTEEPQRLQVAAVSADARARPAYVSAPVRSSRDKDESRMPTASIPRVNERRGGATTGEARDAASTATPVSHWIAGPSGKAALRAATHFQPPLPPSRTETKTASLEAKDVRPEPKVVAKAEEGVSTQARQLPTAKPQASGWMIQIGATDDADKAAELISKAKAKRGSFLASAKPFTEKVQKGHGAIYRARFAGLEETQAEAACKALKNSGFSCFTTRN